MKRPSDDLQRTLVDLQTQLAALRRRVALGEAETESLSERLDKCEIECEISRLRRGRYVGTD